MQAHHCKLPVLGKCGCPNKRSLFRLPLPWKGEPILQLLAYQQLQIWQREHLHLQRHSIEALLCASPVCCMAPNPPRDPGTDVVNGDTSSRGVC